MTISTYMIGHNDLQTFTIYTLVDITNTGITRYNQHVSKERNQQRNWETILQAFGLRSLPVIVQPPILYKENLDKFNFGSDYTGTHSVWVAKIGVETHGVYKKNNDATGLLKEDFDQVPVITGLNETAMFSYNGFICAGATKNIYFIVE